MTKLPITKAMREIALKKGWIKTIAQLFPEIIGQNGNSQFVYVLGKWHPRPNPSTEIWVAGTIGPCEIVVV